MKTEVTILDEYTEGGLRKFIIKLGQRKYNLAYKGMGIWMASDDKTRLALTNEVQPIINRLVVQHKDQLTASADVTLNLVGKDNRKKEA